MPLVPIHNVSSIGIVTDVPATELPPEAWSAGQNVRFRDGKVVKFQGQSAVFGAPSVTPYGLVACQTATTPWWLYLGLLKAYATDGATHFNITRQVANAGALTAALAGAGAGNLSAGAYTYKVTFVNANGETALGTISNSVTVTDPAVNGQMSLTSIPLGGTTVTSRRIYRTTAGGSSYLLLTTIGDNVTTTFADNIADASLGAVGPATNSADWDYSATAELKWTGGVLNGVPVINNGIDKPQQWSPIAGGTKLIELNNWSTWPSSTICGVLRPAFRNFLFALDITEGATRYADTLAWSHPADPGLVPGSWNYTSAIVDTGRVSLSDTPGFLLDMEMLGRAAVIYKEDAMYISQYIGGQFVFSFDPISLDTGILATNCVKSYPKGHFVVTQDDIITHSGSEGSIQSIIDSRYRKYLFESMDTTYKSRSFVVRNSSKSEIWFCYPEAGQTQPTRAFIWNWETGAIGDRQLGAEIAAIGVGAVEPTATAQNWDADSDAWNSDSTVWDLRTFDPANTRLLMARSQATAALYQADTTEQFAGTEMLAYIERTGLSIVGRDREGRPRADADSIKYVRRVLPRIKGGPVYVYVGAQETKDGPVNWNEPYLFDPGTDTEAPCDVVGRFIGVRFEGTAAWELDSYELDIEIVGRYP